MFLSTLFVQKYLLSLFKVATLSRKSSVRHPEAPKLCRLPESDKCEFVGSSKPARSSSLSILKLVFILELLFCQILKFIDSFGNVLYCKRLASVACLQIQAFGQVFLARNLDRLVDRVFFQRIIFDRKKQGLKTGFSTGQAAEAKSCPIHKPVTEPVSCL